MQDKEKANQQEVYDKHAENKILEGEKRAYKQEDNKPDGMNKKLNNPGNALARVQRVHEPADLWDITFCTR